MTKLRLQVFLLLLLALVPASLWLGTQATGQDQQNQTTILGNLISRALSTPTTRVSIGAVEGALTSDATIRNVTIADREGVWLRLDRARLVWRRTALLQRRLEIQQLEIGTLEILRRPLPGEEAVPGADEPILPDLPIKIDVDSFSIQELALGEPVLGTAARLQASGSAELGDPSEGLDLNLTARRLDAPGRFDVSLAYVPETNRLDLSADLQEPEGGLVARWANIPGLPPVELDLTGSGTLDDWHASLAFQAGPDIGATGQARVARTDAARRLTVDLSAQVEGLLPPPVAPVFAGTTSLEGAVVFGDAGPITLEDIELTSRAAQMTITGTISEDRVLDITARAQARPTDGPMTRAGEVEIERLNFEARVTGPLMSPTIVGDLDAAGLRLPVGTFEEVQADLTVEPVSDGADDRFRVNADARATGIALSDPALRNAVGREAELALRGVFTTDLAGEIETLRVNASNADLRYEGRLGPNVVDGTLRAELPRLRAFSGLAGRRLSGSVRATAHLEGDPARGTVRADVDARGTDLSFAQPVLDGLTGGRLTLQGVVRRMEDGYAFEDLRLEGEHVEGRVDGSATEETADVTARLDLQDLSEAHPDLSGRAELNARLTGSLMRPDIEATLTTSNASVLGRPLRDFRAELSAQDVTGMLDGSLTLSGMVGDERLDGTLRIRRGEDPVWSLDALDLTLGSATITGRAAVLPGNLIDGTLRISAEDLNDLSPLVLSRLGGNLDATLTLTARDGAQDARLQAQGRSLEAFGVALANLDIDLTATDIRRNPVIDGRLLADQLTIGGQTFENIRLLAEGTPQASELSLSATARGFSLSAEATLLPGDPIRLRISQFTAERGGERFALAEPTTLVFREGAVTVDDMVIRAGAGRLSLDGRIGDDLDLRVEISDLPLSITNVFLPDLGLAGTLNGEVELRGSLDEPRGSYRLNVSGFSSEATRDAGLPPPQVTASGELRDGRATVNAEISAGPEVQLQVEGSVPLDATGELALTVQGRIDPALANALLGPGRRIGGQLDVDLRVGGTVDQPRLEGSATLAGGSYTDALRGITITDIQGRFVGAGDVVRIERLTGRTRNGGVISVAGQVAVDPGAGFPGSLRVTADRAELVASDLVTAVADLDLTIEGPLARTPRIAGRVDIISMNVSIPDRLPATLRPLPGTRHIAPPPHVRARLAAERRERAEERRAPPFEATLDVVVNARNRIFVRGRGVDAELGGELRLTGTSRDPVAIGSFDLRRGRFVILGQRLDFTRGRLTFTGDLTPEVDLVAETRAGDITAQVVISGPANQPEFELTSEPDLPQDEVLSRLLFQKASGNLSGFQALQLAQAVAQLAGGGGTDVFEQARRSLGVDSLDITTGARGGPAIGISRYIGDRVSVGVRAGARPEDTGVQVNIDVTRRLKVQGEVGVEGRTSIGIGAEWEY